MLRIHRNLSRSEAHDRMNRQTEDGFRPTQAETRPAELLPPRFQRHRISPDTVLIVILGVFIGAAFAWNVAGSGTLGARSNSTSAQRQPIPKTLVSSASSHTDSSNPVAARQESTTPPVFRTNQTLDTAAAQGDHNETTALRTEQFVAENSGGTHGSTISGMVYFDTNNDGLVADDEEPLAGVSLELLNSAGLKVATTASLADGTYTFQDLDPGLYTVFELQPGGYLDGLDTPGLDAASFDTPGFGNEATLAQPKDDSITITLQQFTQSRSNNFGERPGAIRGTVLENASGTDDPLALISHDDVGPESRHARSAVQLLDDRGAVIATTTTDSEGLYRFSNLAAGEYSIRKIVLGSSIDPLDQSDTPNAPPSNEELRVALTPGQLSVQNNFTEPTGEISGVSWLATNDRAAAGEADSEAPISTVRLRNSAGSVVATTVANPNGVYSFKDLPAGNYVVEQLPLSKDRNGSWETVQPNDTLSVSVTHASLDPSGYPDQAVKGNSSIYGTVFADTVTTNGLQDSSFGGPQEVGLPGVTVTLLTADGELIATTTTNNNGDYAFGSLAAGTYSLVETQPAGYLDGIDRIGILRTSPLPDKHKNLVLCENTYRPEVNFGERNRSASPGQISGTAFVDLDENELLSDSEPRITGAYIMVYSGTTGAYVSGTITDSNGEYSISGLPAGTYRVIESQLGAFGDRQETSETQSLPLKADDPSLVAVAPNGKSTGVNFATPSTIGTPKAQRSADATAQLSAPVLNSTTTIKLPPNQLSFGGHIWTIKSSDGLVGPGPNQFAAENITVDAAGNLHLRISQDRDNGNWYSSEIINTSSFGYGTYRWTTTSDLTNLDRNVVLGLFTWNDLPIYANREIDIEVARWGNPGDPTNAQFVVQPSDITGHLRRFTQPFGGPTTLQFTWAPGRIDYLVRSGAVTIESWRFVGPDVPIPGGENARMNLWQHQGLAPSNGKPLEVVFTGFDYCTPSGICQ
jgi:SdrD B-like domain